MTNSSADPYQYTATNGRIYEITPSDGFVPKTGDNTGLLFQVREKQLDKFIGSLVIRISGSLEAIWGLINNHQLELEVLTRLGIFKLEEEIEELGRLQLTDYMFISSDPIVGDTVEQTINNLQQELGSIRGEKQNRNYAKRKENFSMQVADMFSHLDAISHSVKKGTGHSVFTTTISGIQSYLYSMPLATQEEYHSCLLNIALPLEVLDFSFLDKNFPTQDDIREVKSKLSEITGEKEAYYFLDTIHSISQLQQLFKSDSSLTPYIQTIRDIHYLRNTPPQLILIVVISRPENVKGYL